MKSRLLILLLLLASVLGCSRSRSFNHIIDAAEDLIDNDTDSAFYMLDKVDPTELVEDSLKAKYHYLRAWGHMRQNRSLIGDSLIKFAHSYYSGKDIVRDMRSGTALAF